MGCKTGGEERGRLLQVLFHRCTAWVEGGEECREGHTGEDGEADSGGEERV